MIDHMIVHVRIMHMAAFHEFLCFQHRIRFPDHFPAGIRG